MASHRQFAKDQASSESQNIESRLKTSTARLEAGNLVHDDGIGPLCVNRNSYVATEMWSGVRTQPWTEWSHVFFVSFMSPPDRRISRKSSSNLKLVIWRWIARGTANEPRMIRNVLCFFYAYHWSWFQLFQFWLLCFIKSFRWTNGTKIYHVCREEAANLSAHVSSDIPSISQYTSNWPAKITNSGIQYLIINQLHNKLYI